MIDQLPIGSTIWPEGSLLNGIVRYIRATAIRQEQPYQFIP